MCSSVNLSELLPYDAASKRNGSLRTSLKEYRLLCVASTEAMEALKRSDFEQFDAVVGENACQIRAAKIAMTASNCLQSTLQSRIKEVEGKMDGFCLEPLMRSGMSLRGLLDKEALDVALTPDEFFFILTFLLSVAKTVKPSDAESPLFRKDAADPKKLKQFGEVGGSFANSLVNRLRQLLSTASVAFVQEQAQRLGDEQLIRMSGQEFTINYNNCPSIPMFWTYKTLLLSAEKAKVPLVLYARFLRGCEVVNESCLFFNATGSSYEELVPYERDLAKTAIFVQGVVCSKSRSFKRWKAALSNVRDVILAGAADHRQYPNGDGSIEGFQEYEEYKTRARREGYSLENPGMFFIQHVYPALVGSAESLTQKMRFAEQIMRTYLPGRALDEWPQRAATQIVSYLEKEGE